MHNPRNIMQKKSNMASNCRIHGFISDSVIARFGSQFRSSVCAHAEGFVGQDDVFAVWPCDDEIVEKLAYESSTWMRCLDGVYVSVYI